MTRDLRTRRRLLLILTAIACLGATAVAPGADHNDPNAINSIFSDVPISAADLYDLFGFPSDDTGGGEKVVVALTFASIPRAGVFDPEVLYRLRFDPDPRPEEPMAGLGETPSLGAMLEYADIIGEKLLKLTGSEVRVRFDDQNRAKVSFIDFPGGTFDRLLETNKVHELEGPGGAKIKVFIGGRDDAFFNDLPGFFRSINYAPQFYRVPLGREDLRELPIPKTLLELEGNTLFNFDPSRPEHGQGVKLDLPPGPHTWAGGRFKKDDKGNYRFVYSGRDAQAGINVNAIILEIPLGFLTEEPGEERIVNCWGESWVLKASSKAESIPDDAPASPIAVPKLELILPPGGAEYAAELEKYKHVDSDGQPFQDAALNERIDEFQGPNNISLARRYILRFAHLGWGFGPSISALGLKSSFDHGNAPVSVHRTYKLATLAYPRVEKALFQELRMPDDSWNKSKKEIPLRRPVEIFLPNVCSIDMDTTGTWPFGRRPEDQVATRFLSIFLDHGAMLNGKPYHVEILGDQSLWDAAPIEPKTPPNPLKNDKEFLKEFPYLAEPW